MHAIKATIKRLPLQTCLLLDQLEQNERNTALLSYLFKAATPTTVALSDFETVLAKCEHHDVIIITDNYMALQEKLQSLHLQPLLAKHRFYVVALQYSASAICFSHTPHLSYINSLDCTVRPHQIKLALQKEIRFIRKKILKTLIASSKQKSLESKALGSKNFQSTLNFLVHAYYTNAQFTTQDLAKMMGVSVSTLERKTFQLTGKTPKQYLLEYRLLKAKNDLITSFKKIGYIAKSNGFATASYFSISFFERFGITPSQVRQSAASSAG
ncbi:MAG: helix-turn-helix transcriptional regulator [Sphingobacteriaceae bacterium]|nr:helix-turn-helix transcriptional regulator [Sphingobacteriaceae bacterium]